MKQFLHFICLFCVFGFFVLFRLGNPPLFDPDEPRYAESAREMNERGSLLIPYFNHEPRLNKPVLYYWVIAATYRLFGASEFSARLGSALAALLLFAATFFFARQACGQVAAPITGLILGSMPLFLVPARLAMPDMVFSLWMVLSLYCFYIGWEAVDARRRWLWFCLFYLFQVVAAWTKGPVGILVPLAVALLCLARTRDRAALRSLKMQWAVPIVLLLSLPWYLYIFLFVDRQLMLGLAGNETAGRMFGIGRNYEPVYYYVPALIGGLFPWIFLLPWAWYQRRRVRQSRFLLFCETWFLFVILFFSLCAGKKFQYITMLSAVSALWLGNIITETIQKVTNHRDIGFISAIFAGFCIVLVAGFEGVAWISKHEPSLFVGGALGFCALLAPMAGSLLCAARGYKKSAITLMSGTTLFAVVVFLLYGAPWLGERRSTRELVKEYGAVFEKASAVYCASKVFNSLVFYCRRPVYLDVDEDYIVEKLRSAEPCVCVMSRRRARDYAAEIAPFFLGEKYGRMILTNVYTEHPP